MLRSAFTTVASLGAVHALAGATQFVVSRTSVSGTVGAAVPVVAFSVSGSPASPGSYRVTSLPPGVTITGVAANGIFNGSTGTLSGTPTASGTFLAAITAYQDAGARGDAYGPATVAFVIAPATPVTAVFRCNRRVGPSRSVATLRSPPRRVARRPRRFNGAKMAS